VNTEWGPTAGHGPEAGSADQSDAAGTEQGAASVGSEIKQEFAHMLDSVKTELEDAEAKKHVSMTVTPPESNAIDVSSTVQSESDVPAADVAKQDSSDVKSEDRALKEEEDIMENDDQNADGKQSAQYWNYHWPKVCGKLCKLNFKNLKCHSQYDCNCLP